MKRYKNIEAIKNIPNEELVSQFLQQSGEAETVIEAPPRL